jgi:hypothetical protein
MASKTVLVILVIWFILALAAGYFGFLNILPFPFPQIVLLFLFLLQIVLYWKSTSVKSWIDGVEFRPLILFHLTRFVGFLFLYLYSVGRLPSEFALVAGWGDIFVAVTAVLLTIAISFRRLPKLILIWNIIGLADIILVLITGARLGAGDPRLMAEFTKLPLSLLPTFVVPIVLSTHVFIFKKLFDRRSLYSSQRASNNSFDLSPR